MPVTGNYGSGFAVGPMTAVTPTGSPFEWQNPEAVPVSVMVSAGTVTALEVANWDKSYVASGLLGGQLQLKPQCWFRVTYLTVPSINYTPA
jgi:hypothetical protein